MRCSMCESIYMSNKVYSYMRKRSLKGYKSTAVAFEKWKWRGNVRRPSLS